MTGAELYARRVQLDYSQAALARLLGVATLTVSRWERGKNRIPRTAELALKHVKANRTHLPSLAEREGSQ